MIVRSILEKNLNRDYSRVRIILKRFDENIKNKETPTEMSVYNYLQYLPRDLDDVIAKLIGGNYKVSVEYLNNRKRVGSNYEYNVFNFLLTIEINIMNVQSKYNCI